MEIHEDGWLEGDEIERLPSHRFYDELDAGPLGVVWHTIDSIKDARQVAQGIVDASATDTRSWHFLATRDGKIIQSVSLRHGAWHCKGKGLVRGVERRINKTLISVELEYAGRVKCLDDGKLRLWPFRESSPVLPKDRAELLGNGQWWDTFTEEQVAVVEKLAGALVDFFGWERADLEYAHSHFDPVNKEDPGPVWMRDILPGMLDRVFSRKRLVLVTEPGDGEGGGL